MLLSISSILSAQSDSLRDISFLRRPNPDANIQHAEADSFFKNFLKHFIITLLNNNDIIYRVANSADTSYSETIAAEMASSAAARGTGIAVRTPEYLSIKMQEGKSIIAVTTQGKWVGFCYIETWQHGEYVANSGLIVHPAFRKSGVAKQIKNEAFNLSRTKYPNAKLFGLTTGLAVMKINSDLGYEPVTYGELTQDDAFWAGCKSCVNFDILTSKGRKNCLCTAMLYDPADHYEPVETQTYFEENVKGFERLLRLKQWKFLNIFKKKVMAVFFV